MKRFYLYLGLIALTIILLIIALGLVELNVTAAGWAAMAALGSAACAEGL